MTRFERVFVWLGGALFVGSLGLWVWWYVFHLSHSRPWGGWRPLGLDVVLFTVFAAHHSVFARDGVKARLAAIPRRLIRSVYVWIASLLLIAVCLLWQTIGGDVYQVPTAGAIALALVQLVGLWFIAGAVARIDPLELAGIRSENASGAGSTAAARPSALQITGPYRWVRHPIYLGWILLVFGVAHMTGDRLAFAVVSSLYLIAAVPWEERSLRQSFGADYDRYTRQVRWRVLPYMY
jgi:protein-S-isoprenylcysteine O-methyltransferase Ste14